MRSSFDDVMDAVRKAWERLDFADTDEAWAEVMTVVTTHGWTEGEWTKEAAAQYDKDVADAFGGDDPT